MQKENKFFSSFFLYMRHLCQGSGPLLQYSLHVVTNSDEKHENSWNQTKPAITLQLKISENRLHLSIEHGGDTNHLSGAPYAHRAYDADRGRLRGRYRAKR